MTGISLQESFEKRNETIGWCVSIGFHGAILLLLYFSLAWKKQIIDPPPYEYGIAVNFGTSDEGFGDVQNFSNPGNEPAPEKTEATPSTPMEESQPVPESQEPEKVITGVEETINLSSEPKPKKAVEAEPTPVKTTTTKPSAQSLFPSESSSPSSNNNGNKPGTTGDMGKPKGDPDARGIYEGNPGNGRGGSSLDMSGWRWDEKPVVNDESSEEGKIVFQIKVDNEGNIVSVNVLEKNVSSSVVKKYQKAVENLTFSRTSGAGSGDGASGRITFLITSK